MKEIAHSLEWIKKEIQEAAGRAGRDPGEITLIAASKKVPTVQIEEAVKGGVRVFGENRVQEANEKFLNTGLLDKVEGLHLIGPLQSNKVKRAVGFFGLIHSIDSVGLAARVEREAANQSVVQDVLVEVNIGGEASKHGVSPKEAPALVEAIRGHAHLSLLGLMTIPPYHPDCERARPFFSALRELGFTLGLSRFSMGMSSDFGVAIEEGATWVRIGTAIFGSRENPS